MEFPVRRWRVNPWRPSSTWFPPSLETVGSTEWWCDSRRKCGRVSCGSRGWRVAVSPCRSELPVEWTWVRIAVVSFIPRPAAAVHLSPVVLYHTIVSRRCLFWFTCYRRSPSFCFFLWLMSKAFSPMVMIIVRSCAERWSGVGPMFQSDFKETNARHYWIIMARLFNLG